MLELDATTPANNLIKESNETTFMEDVVEASKTTPIIVDFWAPWCGPCKTLGPALEAAVTAANGKVKMVKVNVDENQTIASQLRVQSIPTVFAFHDGQPVDGFQGAVPPSEIEAFIQRAIALAPKEDNGLGDAVLAAKEMLAEGAADDAAQTFSAVLDEEAENPAAYAGLIRAYMVLGETEKAKTLVDSIPPAIANDADVQSTKAQFELAASAADAGEVGLFFLAEVHGLLELLLVEEDLDVVDDFRRCELVALEGHDVLDDHRERDDRENHDAPADGASVLEDVTGGGVLGHGRRRRRKEDEASGSCGCQSSEEGIRVHWDGLGGVSNPA